MKGTKKYEKPLLVVEKFTPNEYVAGCWKVNGDNILTELYHDTKRTTNVLLLIFNSFGYYDNGEQVTTPPISQIPSSGNIQGNLPNNLATGTNGNRYYDERHLITGTRTVYEYPTSSELSTVYSYNYNGTTYYFKDYDDLGGNHS